MAQFIPVLAVLIDAENVSHQQIAVIRRTVDTLGEP